MDFAVVVVVLEGAGNYVIVLSISHGRVGRVDDVAVVVAVYHCVVDFVVPDVWLCEKFCGYFHVLCLLRLLYACIISVLILFVNAYIETGRTVRESCPMRWVACFATIV